MPRFILEVIRTHAIFMIVGRVAMMIVVFSGAAIIMPTLGIRFSGMGKGKRGNQQKQQKKRNKTTQGCSPLLAAFRRYAFAAGLQTAGLGLCGRAEINIKGLFERVAPFNSMVRFAGGSIENLLGRERGIIDEPLLLGREGFIHMPIRAEKLPPDMASPILIQLFFLVVKLFPEHQKEVFC